MVTYRTKQDADYKPRDEEEDCILRHHSEANHDTNGYPPARIVRIEKANNKVRKQHPPQIIKSHILEEAARNQRYWSSRNRHGGYDLCRAFAAHFSGNQS